MDHRHDKDGTTTGETNMTYVFAKIKVHPKLDLTAWYLVLRRGMMDKVMDLHRSAAIAMFLKFHHNPHLYNQKTWEPLNAESEFYNPVKLSAGWLQTAMNGLKQFGVIYIGTAHGVLFGENIEVLEERASEKFEWPTDSKEGVTITVSSWPDGKHYYLTASNNQVFSKPKFDTLSQAMCEARKYAFENNIRVKEIA